MEKNLRIQNVHKNSLAVKRSTLAKNEQCGLSFDILAIQLKLCCLLQTSLGLSNKLTLFFAIEIFPINLPLTYHHSHFLVVTLDFTGNFFHNTVYFKQDHNILLFSQISYHCVLNYIFFLFVFFV